MSDTPDLSKIIGVIMQNPSLISEIAALANQSEKAPPEKTEEAVEEEVRANSAPMPEQAQRRTRAQRKELLSAIKPYLSQTRRDALDSMATILDVIDVMLGRES